MSRLDRLRERARGSGGDDPLTPPPSERDDRSRIEKLKSKLGADTRAAGRTATEVKQEVAKRASADVRRAKRAATAENAKAVARRAGAAAAAAEFEQADERSGETREQEVARRAEATATAGPIMNATLAPTAPPQGTESLLRGSEPTEEPEGGALLRFGGAMQETGSGGWVSGMLIDSGDGDNVDEGEALGWGDDDNGDPLAWDDAWVRGGERR